MAESTFRVDDAGVAEVLNDSAGPVGRHLHSLGKQIVFFARRNVGKKTHYLQRRISYSIQRGANGPTLVVTANARYALMHHDGTRPHMILPNKSRTLRFKQGGRVVYARAVMHPGTRPNPFLTTAMREALK